MIIKWKSIDANNSLVLKPNKGIDEHGNQYYTSGTRENCICTLVDGRSDIGKTPEDAFKNAYQKQI